MKADISQFEALQASANSQVASDLAVFNALDSSQARDVKKDLATILGILVVWQKN